MRYDQFQRWLSKPRISKYLYACDCNIRQAQALYKANIRLSQAIFAVLGLFEVTLRNAIDRHYSKIPGSDWIFIAARPGGFLHAKGCERSLKNVEEIIRRLGSRYTHDRAVSDLTFGFWTHQFNSKQFSAAGSTLLKIFPARPFGTNHTAIFNMLLGINKLRNRIAHHEPICFEKPFYISADEAKQKYDQIVEALQWLGIDTSSFLFGIDHVRKETARIHHISKPFNVLLIDE